MALYRSSLLWCVCSLHNCTLFLLYTLFLYCTASLLCSLHIVQIGWNSSSTWQCTVFLYCTLLLDIQIAKLSIIPTVCVFETLLNGKSYSREVKLSVVVVMLGVGICTVTDIDIRPAGLIAALVAIVTTSLQQIVSLDVAFSPPFLVVTTYLFQS